VLTRPNTNRGIGLGNCGWGWAIHLLLGRSFDLLCILPKTSLHSRKMSLVCTKFLQPDGSPLTGDLVAIGRTGVIIKTGRQSP
jgi:hypothetical protein